MSNQDPLFESTPGDTVRIFSAKTGAKINYSPDYFHELGIHPILRQKATAIIHTIAQGKYSPLLLTSIPDNSLQLPSQDLEKIIRDVRGLSDKILFQSHTAPIRLVIDDCFTNICLQDTLATIFGENYSKIVQSYIVNHKERIYPLPLDDFSPESTITFFGGSFSDPYDQTPQEEDTTGGQTTRLSYFDTLRNPMATLLNECMLGKRFGVAICFSHQVAAILYNKIEPKSPVIPAALRGAAQFGPTACKILDQKMMDPLDREILLGVSNNGSIDEFSMMMTRTGHVMDLGKTDMMGTYDVLHPLVVDKMTDEEVLIWRMRGLIGIAGHPEVARKHQNAIEAGFFLPRDNRKDRKSVATTIAEDFDCSADDLWHQMIRLHQTYWRQDINISFYAPVLKALLKRLTGNEDTLYLLEQGNKLGSNYDGVMRQVISSIGRRVQYIDFESGGMLEPLFTKTHRFGLLSRLDKARKVRNKYCLKLNDRFDWKVNRGIKESSDICGIEIFNFLRLQQQYLKSQGALHSVMLGRDDGAGNGHLIKDIDDRNKLEAQRLGMDGKLISDMVIYGVGDQIYFDLFQGLEESEVISQLIPSEAHDVLILIVKKIIDAYRAEKKYEHMSLDEVIPEILEQLTFHPTDKILHGSMFAKETSMFPKEHESPMSQEAQDFLLSEDGKKAIDTIKRLLSTQLYEFFSGYLERILLHDFQNYRPEDPLLMKVHAKFSIRSTSHLSDTEYQQSLDNYLQYQTFPGSVFIDNGIHQSYTYCPRIRELAELQKKYQDHVKIRLIYDPSTNYFCSAIIETPIEQNGRKIYRSDEWWSHLVYDDKLLIPIEEAEASTSFQIERWLRDYLMAMFRDSEIFYYFDDDLITALLDSCESIYAGEIDRVTDHIRDFIRKIAQKITQKLHIGKYLKGLFTEESIHLPQFHMDLKILKTFLGTLEEDAEDIEYLLQKAKQNPTIPVLEELRTAIMVRMGINDFERFQNDISVPNISDLLSTGHADYMKLQNILDKIKINGSYEPSGVNIPATKNRRSIASTPSSL